MEKKGGKLHLLWLLRCLDLIVSICCLFWCKKWAVCSFICSCTATWGCPLLGVYLMQLVSSRLIWNSTFSVFFFLFFVFFHRLHFAHLGLFVCIWNFPVRSQRKHLLLILLSYCQQGFWVYFFAASLVPVTFWEMSGLLLLKKKKNTIVTTAATLAIGCLSERAHSGLDSDGWFGKHNTKPCSVLLWCRFVCGRLTNLQICFADQNKQKIFGRSVGIQRNRQLWCWYKIESLCFYCLLCFLSMNTLSQLCANLSVCLSVCLFYPSVSSFVCFSWSPRELITLSLAPSWIHFLKN